MTDIHDTTTKILVVDDEKLIRLTVAARLRSVGYTSLAVGSVEEAVKALKEDHQKFRAVITDIMMGDMDGFLFRDIIRGIDSSVPIFFMTALDPEEGSGFLKRIMEDPNSYYLPKSAKTSVLLRRIQGVVASSKVEQFIQRQVEEQKSSLALAASVQKSMLPDRMKMTKRGFYTTLWRPKEMVSGDLYEAMPFGDGTYLYVLGDIQGHGTSAALAMTAVQSFLKQAIRSGDAHAFGPEVLANQLQRFFRRHLADITYMTALICVHSAVKREVSWISCGAPDLVVVDPANRNLPPLNPEKRGGVPIGMMPDTVYSKGDVVTTSLSDTAVCVAFTDGIYDLGRDAMNKEPISMGMVARIRDELVSEARMNGSLAIVPQKILVACESSGYTNYVDDVTMLMFGVRPNMDGMYEQSVPLNPEAIEKAATAMGQWCISQGWSDSLVDRIQLVLEEALMNVHDHGVGTHDLMNTVASLRLRHVRDYAELTIWDNGTPPPSMAVAGGSSATAFELKNREFSGRGRGRLMTRELCRGISRSRFIDMNETIYHIPNEFTDEGEGK